MNNNKNNNKINGTLNKTEIEKLLERPVEKNGLVITPILNKKKQLEGCGIDLRLSNQFIVFNPEQISHLDIRKLENHIIRKFQKHVIIPYLKPFILHPNTLVLASTLEYLSIPTNVEGRLEGRSSWARHGLIIATACAIDPGYKGCITLELINLGKLPLYLYPGIRLAKLILSYTISHSEYNPKIKKYYCQIGPEFSKLHEDQEIDKLS